MKKFVFLYYGYEKQDQGTMEEWSKWFASIGDKLVDSGNPFGRGIEITKSGSKELEMDKNSVTGYSIVSASNIDDAEKLAKGCPMITSIRIYEALAM